MGPMPSKTLSLSRRAWILAWRDLRMMARRKSTYVLRILFAGGLVLIAAVSWIGRSDPDLDMDIEALARFGQQFFYLLSAVSAVLVGLLAPVFTGGAIAQEKERGTLALLLSTQLGQEGFVLGKLISRLSPLFILITASMPLFASCMLFGGVGAKHVLLLAANLFAIGLLCASVGLLFSALSSRTYEAILITYAVLGAYACLPPLFVWWIYGNDMLYAARWVFPPVGLAVFLDGVRGVRWQQAVMNPVPGAESIPFCLGASYLCIKLSHRCLGRYAGTESISLGRKLLERMDRFFENMNRGMWTFRFRSDELRGNPVAWKERHYRLLGKTHYLIRGIYTLFIFLAVFYSTMTYYKYALWGQEFFHQVMLAILGSFWFLALSVLAATSVAVERDRGSWDLLLTTTMPGRQILWGKVSGSVRGSAVFFALPLIHMVAMWLWNSHMIELQILAWIVPPLAYCLILLCVGFLLWRVARSLPETVLAVIVVGLLLFPLLTMGLGPRPQYWATKAGALASIPLFFSRLTLFIEPVLILASGGVFLLALGTFISLHARTTLHALVATLSAGFLLYIILPVAMAFIGDRVELLLFSPVVGLGGFLRKNNFPDWEYRGIEPDQFAYLPWLAAFLYLFLGLTVLFWIAARFDSLVQRTPD